MWDSFQRRTLLIALMSLSVVASGKPTLTLIKESTANYASINSYSIFPYGTQTYSHNRDTSGCKNLILIHSALDHKAINQFEIPRGLSVNPQSLVAHLDGDPFLLLWNVSEHTPLYGLFPMTDTSAREIGPKGYERRGFGKAFLWGNIPYVLFLGRSAGGDVSFYRMNLSDFHEDEFKVVGSAESDHFDLVEHDGHLYGLVTGGNATTVFDVFRDRPLVPDRRISFDTVHPQGLSGGKLFTLKENATIPCFDKKTWWDTRTLSVNFMEPFHEGRADVGEGMLLPYPFGDDRLARHPGAPVNFPRILNLDASFFVEAGELYGVFPIAWTETSNRDLLRHYIYNREKASLVEVTLPTMKDGRSGLESSNSGIQVFKGPDDLHYGILVSKEGIAYLIRMATGQIVSQLTLPTVPADGRFEADSPHLFTREVDSVVEYYFTGNISNYRQNRTYTVRIEF